MDDYFDALDTMSNTITLLSIIIAEILEGQMLKKSRIFVNRISKVRHTTTNWIVRILNEATSLLNI